jgi:hypothetical protein
MNFQSGEHEVECLWYTFREKAYTRHDIPFFGPFFILVQLHRLFGLFHSD